jgi:hypothetical protein
MAGLMRRLRLPGLTSDALDGWIAGPLTLPAASAPYDAAKTP